MPNYEQVAAGAAAAADGLGQLANPYLREEALPLSTGESIRYWTAKVLAWDQGWKRSREISDRLALIAA